MEKVGIYRNEKDMQQAVEELQELRRRYKQVRVQDTSTNFNTDLWKSSSLEICLIFLY